MKSSGYLLKFGVYYRGFLFYLLRSISAALILILFLTSFSFSFYNSSSFVTFASISARIYSDFLMRCSWSMIRYEIILHLIVSFFIYFKNSILFFSLVTSASHERYSRLFFTASITSGFIKLSYYSSSKHWCKSDESISFETAIRPTALSLTYATKALLFSF